MNEPERLSLTSSAFINTRMSFDTQLENLITAMNKKEISKGTIALKADITLRQIAAIDPETGKLANIYKPNIKTKVTSKISAKADIATEEDTEEISIGPDENGIPVFKPIDTAQTCMNI